MPLIQCPECSKEISTLSDFCIGCGCPQSAFGITGALAPAQSDAGVKTSEAVRLTEPGSGKSPIAIDGPSEFDNLGEGRYMCRNCKKEFSRKSKNSLGEAYLEFTLCRSCGGGKTQEGIERQSSQTRKRSSKAYSCRYCGCISLNSEACPSCKRERPKHLQAQAVTRPRHGKGENHPASLGSANPQQFPGPALVTAFARGFDWESRSGRGDYWKAVASSLIVTLCLAVIDRAADLFLVSPNGMAYGVTSTLFAIIWLVPGISLSIRRLHDVGLSGWNLLWVFTGIGIVYLLFTLARPSSAIDD